jgi:hypothetical protein
MSLRLSWAGCTTGSRAGSGGLSRGSRFEESVRDLLLG